MAVQVFAVAMVIAVGLLVGRFVANRTGIPDATVYVALGVGAGFLPGVAELRLSPDAVLLLFLPPLIYYAAFFSDPRESLRNLVAVLGQSVGLVVATAGVVAGALLVVFPDVGWAAALALGAAVAPPDPVAAGSVLQRLGAPRRLVRVLETEGLINDGVALTVFAVAVGAVGAGLTVGDVLARLGIEVLGGIGFGLVVGVLAARLRGRVRDVPSQVVLSLVLPYLAFVPAQLVHASGVLATVTTAVWLGTRGRGLVAPEARLQTETFWRALNTLLVGVLFVLLGVQAPAVLGAVAGYPVGEVVVASVAVVLATVAVRIGWVLLVAPLLQRLPIREELAAHMPWQERIVLAWCGPRGAVSLAVALSIPLLTAAGEPFPRRDLLLFLTMVVVLATVVGQTLPLPWLLALVGLRPHEHELTEGARARRAAVDAALRELDNLPSSSGAEALRQVLELRRDHLREQLGSSSTSSSDTGELRLRLIEVEREELRRMYDEGEISRGTMVEISQELDLDETNVRARRSG
ncbi:cation:proton antiporter [Pseudonocardia sp. CA-107938]|uniref:cation:proton antiporter n=1 Tax=Pseudonocardia sp. CA-107938 TaxID=3240021 RepID=UPI003D8C6258